MNTDVHENLLSDRYAVVIKIADWNPSYVNWYMGDLEMWFDLLVL